MASSQIMHTVNPCGTFCSPCRLHGELAATVVRDSAAAVQQELLQCYALIERLGRGVVYYGSARLKANSAHWDRAHELGRQVARLLGCTTWSGGGPGMMEAATRGARDLPDQAVPMSKWRAQQVDRDPVYHGGRRKVQEGCLIWLHACPHRLCLNMELDLGVDSDSDPDLS
jgi:hypothetical protein